MTEFALDELKRVRFLVKSFLDDEADYEELAIALRTLDEVIKRATTEEQQDDSSRGDSENYLPITIIDTIKLPHTNIMNIASYIHKEYCLIHT